jgi:hypothetical protein
MSLIRFVLQPNKMMVFNDTISRWVFPTAKNYINKTGLICDRANEDHCGTCGNGLLYNNPDISYYITQKANSRNVITSLMLEKIFTEEERYYFPFTL